jgi:hypothetical protein
MLPAPGPCGDSDGVQGDVGSTTEPACIKSDAGPELTNKESAMSGLNGSLVGSRRFLLFSIILIGSLWGLVESTAGIGLRGGCARFHSGSILTGMSLLFFAGAYTLTGRLLLVMALPVIAGLFRLYTGLLLGQAVISGAVANPLFAFLVEAVAFCTVIYLIKSKHVRSVLGGSLAGMTSAVLAANLFLPVKWVTGIPACVVPGTDFPLAIWGLPVAMAVAAVSTPLGFRAGDWIRQWIAAPEHERGRVLAGASVIVSAVCLLAVTVLHVR